MQKKTCKLKVPYSGISILCPYVFTSEYFLHKKTPEMYLKTAYIPDVITS